MVGVLASQNLTFSPVVATGDDGRSWADGVLPGALTPGPRSLAAAPGGPGPAPVAALVGPPGPTQRVLTTPGDLVHWAPLGPAPGAAPAARTGCRPTGYTALAYASAAAASAGSGGTGALYAGAACSRPGGRPLVALPSGRPAGPPVPAGATATVMALTPQPAGGLAALVALARPGHLVLVAAWSDPTGTRWATSIPLPARSVSSVVADRGRFWVLLGPAGRRSLDTIGPGPGARPGLSEAPGGWRTLPPPPPGTATAAPLSPAGGPAGGQAGAVPPGGGLAAVAPAPGPGATTITVWDLTPGAAAWTRTQTLSVPILYGGSS